MFDNFKSNILKGDFDSQLKRIYITDDAVATQRERYVSLVEDYSEHFGENGELHFFTAPGRTEVCGNH
ncbi:MAG: galactokinase, partial [Clostridia bacterium]|nr:galactokinase [Clostridia bacterium]